MSALANSHSSGDVPFRLKIAAAAAEAQPSKPKPPSPLPPCSNTDDSVSFSRHSIYVPLPPRLLRPAQVAGAVEAARSCSGKGAKKPFGDVDPFLAAFVECTGSGKKRRSAKEKLMGLRVFSCRCDSGVREGVMVRKKTMEKEG